MPKISTIVAFFASMLVTTFFTATSCLGIYLYVALRGDIQRGRKMLRLDQQKAMLKERGFIEAVTDAA